MFSLQTIERKNYAKTNCNIYLFQSSKCVYISKCNRKTATKTAPEHIYAEPSCAQQPLLPNEYASPADGHLTSMDLYTEPINERGNSLVNLRGQYPSSFKTSQQLPYSCPISPKEDGKAIEMV